MDNKFEALEPVRVEALDEILGKPFNVLDDGFIRVIDYMGSDQAIVQAARVSYGSGTKQSRQDRGLIRYLLRNRHTSPLEMCEIKLHIRIPMDAWRQWIRHRTASVNEYSTRYSIAIDSAMKTLPGEWRVQATSNKQGSDGYFEDKLGKDLTEEENKLHEMSKEVYNRRIEAGVAREQARKDLPLATYTEAYWKIDLHNLLHFLALRMDSHAQLEIRKYAEIIGNEIVKRWVPYTWEAFEDYIVNSFSVSQFETEILGKLFNGDMEGVKAKAEELGWLKKKDDGSLVTANERIEFENKLKKMNIEIPW